MAVCTFASQTYRYDRSYSGSYTGGPFKGVLHTTEGTSLPSYRGGAEAPHFTVVPDLRTRTVRIYQHYNTSRPARALVNESGGVQTNNDGCIQIELVGTCDPSTHRKWARAGYAHIYWPEAPKWALDGLAKLMRWVEANHGVPRKTTDRPWLAYPDSYGRSAARMGGAEFDSFAGWIGHMHVAENWHGDPGNLPIAYLIAGPSLAKTTVVKAGTTIAALATALGLSITALTGANPALPATPDATVTPGTTVTLPAQPPVVQAPRPPVVDPAKPPRATGTSYRVVTAPASSRPLLRKGHAGAAVKVVQQAVGVRADGLFGAGTTSAVRAYQSKRGLVADGIVGARTWASILSTAPSASAHPTLRQGATGPAVARVQSLAGARADGVFGPATDRAVRAVQRAHGLAQDGIVGPRTWAVLEQGNGAAARPVLRLGAESRHVRTVQSAVGARVDGVFGPETERKVRAFQSRHGLTADGIVGPRTWGAVL